MGAIKSIRLRWLATLHPIPSGLDTTAMPSIADPAHVAVASRLVAVLARNSRVADPAGSTCTMCQWAACAPAASAPPPDAPAPPGAPPVTPEDLPPSESHGLAVAGSNLFLLFAAAAGAWYIYKQQR